MVTIRPETINDHNAIKTVNDLAFKGEAEGRLVNAIRNSQFFIPELSLCAVNEEGNIVGHLLLSNVYIDNKDETFLTLALAPMSVLPDFQDLGIGSLLVKEGLDRAGKMGFKHAVVLGHPSFYPKFGFQPSTPKGILPPFPVPEEVFMMIELEKDSLAGIQGKVRYPPAFDNVT